MSNKSETLKAGLGNGVIVSLTEQGHAECDFYPEDFDLTKPYKLVSIDFDNYAIYIIKSLDNYYYELDGGLDCEFIKPHLFPLDHLTKPIRVEGYNGGEPFVPVNEMCEEFSFSADWFTDLEEGNLSICGFMYSDSDDIEHKIIATVNGKISEELPIIHYRFLQKLKFNTENLPTDQFINAAESKVYEPK